MLPIITPSPEELTAQELTDTTLGEAHQLFNTNGTLVIKHVIPPDTIDTLHHAFMQRYERYLNDQQHEDALQVGNKRFMVTVGLDAPFNNPTLYANPLVKPVITNLLMRNHILSSFGVVVSLPGSQDQHVHRDFPGLFSGSPLEPMLPAYAITMIVPLVDVNEITGTTLVWPQSHRSLVPKPAEDPELPTLERGDCLLMDYRLVHGGSANNSDHARPILYNIYSRPWFRDHVNYKKQARLEISPELLQQVPEQHQHLFAHLVANRGEW